MRFKKSFLNRSFNKLVQIMFYFWLMNWLSMPLEATTFEPLVYMRPNETPVFTEIYQRYGLLNPLAIHVYDSSIYLGQPGKEGLLIPSSDAFFKDVDQTLRAYHARLESQELFIADGKHIFCPTNGSLQIIFGLVYAIATSQPEKQFLFVEKSPFYSFHEHAVSFRAYPNARFQSFKDPSEVKLRPGEILVEFVTSPNNPDGTFRKPYTDANIIIADFVFASSSFGSDGTGYIKDNIAWVSQARNAGKHVFAFNSVSKSLGRPGFRLGYMWFPMSDSYAASIFKNFFSYTWKLTVGESTSGVAEALNLISAITALPDAGQSMRNDVYKTIVKRHNLVKSELLNRYPGTEIVSIEGSPTIFAKLKSPDIAKMTGEEILYRDLNVSVDNGQSMGQTPQFVRINLCGYSGDIAEFLNRLANKKIYRPEDMLIASQNLCTQTTIHSSDTAHYVANPNDCNINVDAQNANVQITLPPFINYQRSNLISIRKTDSSNHSVTVKANKTQTVLKQKDEQLRTRWTQPFFLNGQWKTLVP